ncbi:MAG: 2OG-Fe(II) oxygenase [Frankia sp.]
MIEGADVSWDKVALDLETHGFAVIGPLLHDRQCAEMSAMFHDDDRFRQSVSLSERGFGAGRYRYFANPVPPLVTRLRQLCYAPLADIVNRWTPWRGEHEFPATLEDMVTRCRTAGQNEPAPLLLRFATDDYNCLHQDIYGSVAFPLQLVVMLSRPGVDFEGGEFVLMEQVPGQEPRPRIVTAPRGCAIVFPTRSRVLTANGVAGVADVSHGVASVRSGERYTLGVIFHEAS